MRGSSPRMTSQAPSLPGLTRQSILFAKTFFVRCRGRWMRGSSPRMTWMVMSYWVYILASGPGGTLYVGMTNNLIRRIYEHREGFVKGFTRRYGDKRLVYFEAHDTALAALQREKNIKHWPREWKIDLIVRLNPTWRDLYHEIVR